MLAILGVQPDSVGAELELEPGDQVLAINGQPVRDLLDYYRYIGDENVLLEVRRSDGSLWDLELEKDAGDHLGLEFEHPQPNQCGNNCVFCFVHQLPAGMRRSLYVKDEDFRFSFMYGAYVTLTNIGEAEVERILAQHLSPLYVSVHATDETIRRRLVGREEILPILPLLQRLVAGGIQLHTQIVLCPQINDGACLERSIEDLAALGLGVLTLAIVPVGLTGHRRRLPALRPLQQAEAAAVLERLHLLQQRFLAERGSRFVFAADELYLQAGADFPELEAYEELSQLENGVGLIPLFRAEAEAVLEEAGPLALGPVSLITGVSAYPELERFLGRLSAKTRVPLELHAIHNDFFGGQVTVTGLLTGSDILAQLQGRDLGRALLIPDVVLREGEEVFLDDMTLERLQQRLQLPVLKIETSPWGVLEALEELAAGHPTH
jgi:putative radical SAM enzyme (TIGR03279 family)